MENQTVSLHVLSKFNSRFKGSCQSFILRAALINEIVTARAYDGIVIVTS